MRVGTNETTRLKGGCYTLRVGVVVVYCFWFDFHGERHDELLTGSHDPAQYHMVNHLWPFGWLFMLVWHY
jgi:hypothetical protein